MYEIVKQFMNTMRIVFTINTPTVIVVQLNNISKHNRINIMTFCCHTLVVETKT